NEANKLYPVFVQTKLLGDIYPSDVEKARLTVHESRIKEHLPNLVDYCPGGKYLSLIYVHPTITKTQRNWNRNDLWDAEVKAGADRGGTSTEVEAGAGRGGTSMEVEAGADRGGTSMDVHGPLMQLLMIIDGSNMRDFLPEGVVDLLDSVKGTKRGGEEEAHVYETLFTRHPVATKFSPRKHVTEERFWDLRNLMEVDSQKSLHENYPFLHTLRIRENTKCCLGY
ncbi:hypothetical protein BGX31_004954, partial [Mortierella sp. GBA43]